MHIRYPGNPYTRPLTRRTGAFTLTELMVVIGVVAILIALLLPILSRARASSQTVSCLSNLRQIMMAFNLYAGDNQQQLPDPASTGQSWESLLRPYLAPSPVYHCRADGGLFENLRSSYDWRDTPDPDTTVAGKALTEIRRPDTVFAFDALPDWHSKGNINAALADGSAQIMSYQDCLKNLDKSIYERD